MVEVELVNCMPAVWNAFRLLCSCMHDAQVETVSRILFVHPCRLYGALCTLITNCCMPSLLGMSSQLCTAPALILGLGFRALVTKHSVACSGAFALTTSWRSAHVR